MAVGTQNSKANFQHSAEEETKFEIDTETGEKRSIRKQEPIKSQGQSQVI
jgi:hypothetical protein